MICKIFGRLEESKISDPIKLKMPKTGEKHIQQTEQTRKSSRLLIVGDNDEIDLL